MRRHEREIEDSVWKEKVFNAAPYMTLSLVDDTAPYAVPLNFVYYKGALYFHCAPEGKKLDCIARNPQVAACVVGTARLLASKDGKACGIGMAYESIIVTGIASVVTEPVELQAALDALIVKFGGDPASVPPKAVSAIRLVRIEIVTATGKRANIS